MARSSILAKEVDLLLRETVSPEARRKFVANEARRILHDAQQVNRAALGVVPSHKQFVDGKENAPLESVNLENGRIVFEFDLVFQMLRWIGEQLVLHSPVLTGQYRASHVLLADGVQVDEGEVPPAENYTFVNVVPYARKIERGQSPQAPDGVYEVIAALANRRFGNLARIRFAYQGIFSGGNTALEQWAVKHAAREAGVKQRERQFSKDVRNPAILVSLR